MVEPSNFTLYTSAGPSAGLLVQTNPISGGAKRRASAWRETSYGERHCNRLRQNKANSGRSPVGRGQRDVGRGTNAPNEPNLVRAPRKGRGWPPDPAGARRRQTKPIAAGAAGGASGLQERSYGERHVQQASAKQSQFTGTTPDGRGTGKSAAEPALRRIAPNKPNLPQPGREDHHQGRRP